LAIHAAALTAYVHIYAGEVSALLCADRQAIGDWPYEAVRVGFGASGFDGQLYYVLARDPWRAHGEPIDWPAYRHSRILYPALAWLMTGGDPHALLWVMPALNLAALAGISWLGALIAGHFGRSPWWGFALIFALNAGTPAFRNLTDPLSTLAACGLVTAWLLGWRVWVTAAWAIAAVLSREQNLVLVLIVLLESLIERRWRQTFGLASAVIVWLGWILTLRGVYGEWPFLAE